VNDRGERGGNARKWKEEGRRGGTWNGNVKYNESRLFKRGRVG